MYHFTCKGTNKYPHIKDCNDYKYKIPTNRYRYFFLHRMFLRKERQNPAKPLRLTIFKDKNIIKQLAF